MECRNLIEGLLVARRGHVHGLVSGNKAIRCWLCFLFVTCSCTPIMCLERGQLGQVTSMVTVQAPDSLCLFVSAFALRCFTRTSPHAFGSLSPPSAALSVQQLLKTGYHKFRAKARLQFQATPPAVIGNSRPHNRAIETGTN